MPPILSSIPHPSGRHRRINDRTSCVKHSHIVRKTIATLLRKTIAILLRRQFTSNPLWANSRASESKASSSLECSAERSRESTKLTFYVRQTIAILLR